MVEGSLVYKDTIQLVWAIKKRNVSHVDFLNNKTVRFDKNTNEGLQQDNNPCAHLLLKPNRNVYVQDNTA